MDYKISRKQVRAIQLARANAIEHGVPASAIRINIWGTKLHVDDQYVSQWQSSCGEVRDKLNMLNSNEAK